MVADLILEVKTLHPLLAPYVFNIKTQDVDSVDVKMNPPDVDTVQVGHTDTG